MTGRRDTVLTTLGMGFAVFVLGHDLVYLTEYGSDFGAAMARTGHGLAWTWTVASAFAIAVAMVAIAAWRLLQLRRIAAAQAPDAGHPRLVAWRGLVPVAIRLWFAIGLIAVAFFVLSENWEHLAVGMPLPGFGILLGSTPSAMTLAVFAAIAGVAAAVLTLYRWRHEALLARIRAARAWLRPTSVPRPRAPRSLPGSREPLARRLGGRAPPRRSFGEVPV